MGHFSGIDKVWDFPEHPHEREFSPIITRIPDRTYSVHDKRIDHEDLSPDQAEALSDLTFRALGLNRDDLVTSLGGVAGSGKSTLVPLLAENLGDIRQTAFCCFTGKASNVLQQKLAVAGVMDGFRGTIHSLMYHPLVDPKTKTVIGWERKKELTYTPDGDEWINVKRVIIDEASMVGKKLLDDLLSYRVPVILIGDHGQLKPVQDTSTITTPEFRLEKIHRQAEGNPIIRLSKEIREHGDIPDNFRESKHVRFVSSKEMGKLAAEGLSTLGLDMAILVRTNRDRCELNQRAAGGNIPRLGDHVICLKNTPPIFNGMRGVVQQIEPVKGYWYRIEVLFPDDGLKVNTLVCKEQFGRERTIRSAHHLSEELRTNIENLGMLFDFGMALTVHKAQGSAFEEVILIPDKWGRKEEYQRWLYTGVTRAVNKLYIMRK